MNSAIVIPTGTITFLFSDIEGSTKMWERYPEAMRTAVARHDALLRQAVRENSGYLFKTTGDGIAAAFALAPDAVGAALAAQQLLIEEPWPEQTPLRSRMGLHTGAAELRDGDYFGPTLNRCARLMAAGHGEQVLLSEATQELSRDALPNGVSLQTLGPHRLKDLSRPESVYQLLHPKIRNEFPRLRTLNNPDLPNNLPQQPTSFIGREKVLSEARDLLDKTRLLTLTGAGGSGKTRLSLQIAADSLDQYAEGVWQVELAALSDPALVPQAVASALNIREQPNQTVTQTLLSALKSKTMLLLLDNAEHILAAVATLAAALLRSCPEIKLLVTSRETLGIGGETLYRVPPLTLPDPNQTRKATAESLSPFDSVRLFVERAQAVKTDFSVTNSNAPALAQLCYRLDGIPLAIELAAARARALTVEQINDRLDSRFRLLTGGDRAALPRQQTLRALVDWSYDLLNESEKTLLGRVSVFAGGWTLGAAEAIGAGESDSLGVTPLEDWEILDLLTSLVDKSLVLVDEVEGQSRYRMLETLRQYAHEKQEESGEAEATRRRHNDFFLALAESGTAKPPGSAQVAWMNELDTEYDNLRAALAFGRSGTTSQAFRGERFLRLTGALFGFWERRGYLSEGREYLSDALREAETETPPNTDSRTFLSLRARALYGEGILARGQGDYEASRSLSAESLSLFRNLGDKRNIATLLEQQATIETYQGHHAAAQPLFAESLAVFREIGDVVKIIGLLINQGVLAYHQGDWKAAQSINNEALALARQIGDTPSTAALLGNLGNVAWMQGDLAMARSLYEEGLTIHRAVGNKSSVANLLGNLGLVAFNQGDAVTAGPLFEESLSLRREMGNKPGIALVLGYQANLAASKGNYSEARSLNLECLAIYEEMGAKAGIASSLHNLGCTAYDMSDMTGARTYLVKSLVLRRELGHLEQMSEAVDWLAAVALHNADAIRAATLWSAVQTLRDNQATPRQPPEQAKAASWIEQARQSLGEAAFAAAWSDGAALPWEQVMNLALSE